MPGSDPPPPTLDDELFAAIRRDEPGARDRLLASYLPRLHAFVRIRMTDELRARDASIDIVQSVCKDLVAAADGFDYRGEAEFRSWLFTAALNKIRARHRFHHRERRDVGREQRPASSDADATLLATYAVTFGTPSVAAVADEEIERVERAFAALPEDYREVIGLARIAGLPHAVVAERMQRSIPAVRKLLGRATVRLAELLDR